MNWFKYKTKIIAYARSFYAWVRFDIWRKAIALLLGTICWFLVSDIYVRGKSQQWDTVEEVKVNLRDNHKIFIPRQEIPPVRLKISVNFLARSQRFSASDFLLEIDPSLSSLADHALPPSLQHPCHIVLNDKAHVSRKPAGVTILGFEPPEIEIYYEARSMVQKLVHVPVQGRLKRGLQQEVTVNPESISVSGPLSTMNRLLVIDTEPLLLDEQMINTFSTTLKVFNPNSQLLEIFPKTVEVKVNIKDMQNYTRQKFSSIPLCFLLRSDSSLRVTSDLPLSVESILHGQLGLLEAVEKTKLKAILDLSSFNQPGTYQVPVQIIGLPGDLKAEYINPSACPVKLILLAPSAVDAPALPGETNNEDAP